jgi:omega-amidase
LYISSTSKLLIFHTGVGIIRSHKDEKRHVILPSNAFLVGLIYKECRKMAVLLKKNVTIACVQLSVGMSTILYIAHRIEKCILVANNNTGTDKAANLAAATAAVTAAASRGADIVVLPECFNSPYGVQFFAQYAEPLPIPGWTISNGSMETSSPSVVALSTLARSANIYLVGGSVPEVDLATGKLYNTCLVFSRRGKLLAKHRKIQLFDVSIPGGITFTESKVLSAGSDITTVDLAEFGTIGIVICYDIRFPEISMIAARRGGGCFALICPAAFNTTTGPLHWTLQARARAVDNQIYVVMSSPARSPDPTAYQAWGHSMIVDPQGQVLVEAEERSEIVYAELKPDEIEKARNGIPLTHQRRFDVYPNLADIDALALKSSHL